MQITPICMPSTAPAGLMRVCRIDGRSSSVERGRLRVFVTRRRCDAPSPGPVTPPQRLKRSGQRFRLGPNTPRSPVRTHPPDLAAHPEGAGPGPHGAAILTSWTRLSDGAWRRADWSRAERRGPRPPPSTRVELVVSALDVDALLDQVDLKPQPNQRKPSLTRTIRPALPAHAPFRAYLVSSRGRVRLGSYATGRFPRPPGLARWPHPDVRAEVSRWPRRNGVAVARTRRRRPTGRGGRRLARGWW